MIRTLLTTTALAAALTTGALAQDQKLNDDAGMTPAAPEMNATQPAPAGDAATPSMDAPATTGDTATAPAVEERDILAEVGVTTAEELIGSTVYSADDSDIGEVSDVVVSSAGKIEAMVIDVGGFLGIGAKPVAVELSSLEVRRDENGDPRIYTTQTQETLEAMPEYSADAVDGVRDAAPVE
ncbi:PRC-barrel domain-containing protein [Stappia sp. 28M-7]|uniref:PRC-barrel domain-containing protein n=1 Tax=Stappia sp. 28M-7 TaxID=2762596 RepID=UPI000FEFBBF1|nr:PRC-barrel domain-containing protein [Stappia sp. 28M-7]MBC2860845.1 PRC-barrel domain-containing protein [Stappia sp. 28M-7]